MIRAYLLGIIGGAVVAILGAAVASIILGPALPQITQALLGQEEIAQQADEPDAAPNVTEDNAASNVEKGDLQNGPIEVSTLPPATSAPEAPTNADESIADKADQVQAETIEPKDAIANPEKDVIEENQPLADIAETGQAAADAALDNNTLATAPEDEEMPPVDALSDAPALAKIDPEADGNTNQSTDKSPSEMAKAPKLSAELKPDTPPAPALAEKQAEPADVAKPSEDAADDGGSSDAADATEDAPASDETATDDTVKENKAVSQETVPLRPLLQYSEPARLTSNPDVAIILVMDAQSSVGAEAFGAFPYPVTFAIDAKWDGAVAAMARARANGHEVLALLKVPVDANAQTVGLEISKAVKTLPESVAVIDTPFASLQAGFGRARGAVEQVADAGFGMVLHSDGINPAIALAERAMLPAVLIDAVIDEKGGAPSDIRRALETALMGPQNAAPKVVLGHLRPNTISALFLWGLSNAPKMHDIIPISPILLDIDEKLHTFGEDATVTKSGSDG